MHVENLLLITPFWINTSEWYIKLYLRSGSDVSKIRKDKTRVCKCVEDPAFNEVFKYRTDCKSGYLEVCSQLEPDSCTL